MREYVFVADEVLVMVSGLIFFPVPFGILKSLLELEVEFARERLYRGVDAVESCGFSSYAGGAGSSLAADNGGLYGGLFSFLESASKASGKGLSAQGGATSCGFSPCGAVFERLRVMAWALSAVLGRSVVSAPISVSDGRLMEMAVA